MKYFSSAFILSSIVLLACNKETPVAEFSGITETNSIGLNIGSVDESDWQQTDTWTQKEIDLFEGLEGVNINNEGVSNTSIGGLWIAFPNPAITIMEIRTFGLDNLEYGKLAIVDNEYRIVAEHDFDTNFFVQIDWKEEESNLTTGIYRVYYLYKFLDNDYVYKGHGDLQNESL